MSEMTQEFYEANASMVKSVSRSQHKGATFIDADDIEQAIWLFMVQNYESIKGYSADGLRSFAVRTAKKYAMQERIDNMYFRGNFIYTPDMVEDILAKSAEWVELEYRIDVDGRVDVADAFRALPEGQRLAVFKKFALGESLTDAERKAASRGVEGITNRLNMGTALEAVSVEDAALEV